MKTMKIKLAKLKAKSVFAQMDKIREEFLEFETATGYQDRIEEAFDLMQAVATFINFAAEKNIKKHNKRHIAKMKRYAGIQRVREK